MSKKILSDADLRRSRTLKIKKSLTQFLLRYHPNLSADLDDDSKLKSLFNSAVNALVSLPRESFQPLYRDLPDEVPFANAVIIFEATDASDMGINSEFLEATMLDDYGVFEPVPYDFVESALSNPYYVSLLSALTGLKLITNPAPKAPSTLNIRFNYCSSLYVVFTDKCEFLALSGETLDLPIGSGEQKGRMLTVYQRYYNTDLCPFDHELQMLLENISSAGYREDASVSPSQA